MATPSWLAAAFAARSTTDPKSRPLLVRDFPGRLARDTASCIRQRGEALVRDLLPAFLANAVGTFRYSLLRVFGLLALLLENVLDGLRGGALVLNLRKV